MPATVPTPFHALLAARSRRSLARGLEMEPEALWCLEAGAWLPRLRPPVVPPLPAGVPFVGVGATLALPRTPVGTASPTPAWQALLARCGGLLTAHAADLPPVHSLLLNAAARACLRDLPPPGDPVSEAWVLAALQQAREGGWEMVRLDALDVCHDPRPRVLQVVTSIQRGGAERLVLDLHEELPRQGMTSLLLALGNPSRAPFPTPPGFACAGHLSAAPEVRAREIARLACVAGADVLHAHLLDAPTLSALAATGHGVPVVTTLHNERVGWPPGTETIGRGQVDLFLACSRAVEADLRALPAAPPIRTVWNGIRPPACEPGARARWRGQAGFGAEDFLWVTLANPRPQKRLPLLAQAMAEAVRLAAAGQGRAPGLLVAGEASGRDPLAAREVERFWGVVDAHGLRSRVFWPGPVDDTAGFLAAGDVFVSSSLHEGLSLAQLEALALGLPVVATAVGGAPEVARQHPGMHLVDPTPQEELPARLAAACVALSETIIKSAPAPGPASLPASFTTPVMVARHRWLYAALAAAHARRGKARAGVVLVTNNLSTGGAQTSARRLLGTLHHQGEPVRAVVLQEGEDHPTPGRAALLAEGVPVHVLPNIERVDAPEALLPLLDLLARHPPAALLFWNVAPLCKILLAEALWDIPVWDVSPGEMLFDSLERLLARPRPGLPFQQPADYGRLLAGMVVKYAAEAPRAAALLGRAVHVIPNGVPLPPLASPSSSPPPAAIPGEKPPSVSTPPVFIIGTAARLNPHKKLDHLLAAFRLLHAARPEVVLRIAGGPERGFEGHADELRAQAAGLPVEWLGDVRDMPAFLASLHVFAMISEPSGCPNASLEAMAAGLPVVATAVGGAVDQIVDGESGLLTPRDDAPALAAALQRLLEDAPLRSRLGRAARARVESVFSLERMAHSYRRLWTGGADSAVSPVS